MESRGGRERETRRGRGLVVVEEVKATVPAPGCSEVVLADEEVESPAGERVMAAGERRRGRGKAAAAMEMATVLSEVANSVTEVDEMGD